MKIKADEDFFNSDDNIWDKLVYNVYYKIIPYDYRPSQLWYKLKCFIWHRYTTIKPRYLGHTWCDKTELLTHMNFEMLCEFIEKECSPGIVNWDGDDEHKNIRKEMQELYDWWIKCNSHKDKKGYRTLFDLEFNEVDEILEKYQKSYELSDIYWKEDKTRNDKSGKLYSLEQDLLDEELHSKYVIARMNLEAEHEKFITNQIKRVIECRWWMWT